MKTIVLVAPLLIAFFIPASANADVGPRSSPANLVKGTVADRIMRQATAQMTHAPSANGVDHDKLSIEELVARYDRGERLYIRCGRQTEVSQALLWRAGIRSRMINTLSAVGPFDHKGDGHVFLEVRIHRRWVAYDPDGNRQPVDARGQAMGGIRATYARPFRWRYIASDTYAEAYPDYTYAQLDHAADHALGIPAIQISKDPNEQWVYRGTPGAIARVQSYPLLPPYWVPVGKQRWAKITKDEA